MAPRSTDPTKQIRILHTLGDVGIDDHFHVDGRHIRVTHFACVDCYWVAYFSAKKLRFIARALVNYIGLSEDRAREVIMGFAGTRNTRKTRAAIEAVIALVTEQGA